MGKNNTLIMLAVGVVAAYLLMPEKIKEVVGGVGGGTTISVPGGGGTSIDLSGIFKGFKFPNFNFDFPENIIPENVIPNLPVPPGVPDPVVKIPEAASILDPSKIIDPIIDALGGGGPPLDPSKIIDPILDALGIGGKDGGGAGAKDVWGPVKTSWISTLLNWQENTAKAAKGASTGLDWLTGGWQDQNRVVGAIAEQIYNFFDPHRTVTLTERTQQILSTKQPKDTYVQRAVSQQTVNALGDGRIAVNEHDPRFYDPKYM